MGCILVINQLEAPQKFLLGIKGLNQGELAHAFLQQRNFLTSGPGLLAVIMVTFLRDKAGDKEGKRR